MEFKYQYKENYPITQVKLTPEASLDEVLETFEAFLKCAGYVFNGHVKISCDKGED